MAKLFEVDVSAIPTHEERYKIMELFSASFDVYEEWVQLDASHATIYRFEAFWSYESQPLLPKLPGNVKITEK